MLKTNNKAPYISVFKLSSGEEFVCKVIEETLGSYIVNKPLTIAQTAQGVQFVPILMLADPEKNVTVPKPLIIGEPSPELESQYESITTGITLPKKQSILI